MVIYQGISPPLKYMVMIAKRYQNFLGRHFLLGKHKSQISSSQNRSDGSEYGSSQGD